MRWADLDSLGHVNNVVYVDYLQEARVDMLRVHAPDARAGRLADGVVVVRHHVEFQTPLSFAASSVHRQSVKIESWITEIRAASFTIAYEIYSDVGDSRITYARASTVLTPYVFATERPRRITPEEREGLSRYLESSPPLARRTSSVRVEDRRGYYPAHVRFSDVDVYGHVNNVKYFEYLQEARIALFAALGAEAPQDGALAEPLLVTQTEVDYRVPLLFRSQPYDVWTWISSVEQDSVVIDAEICDGAMVLSRARNVLVGFDPATGHGAALDSPTRRVLQTAIRGY
jgi:acyl-CoA thioester hydrolase